MLLCAATSRWLYSRKSNAYSVTFSAGKFAISAQHLGHCWFAGKLFDRCPLVRPAVSLLLRRRRPAYRAWNMTVASAWSTHVWLNSRRQNIKILSKTILRCYSMELHCVKRRKQSTSNFSTVFGQAGKVVVKVVESTQCRRRGAVAAINVVYVRCCRRRRADNRMTTVLFCYCTTTRCRIRPVAEFNAQSTRRRLRRQGCADTAS